MVRKKTLRLLLCDYQRAAVTILYIGLSKAGRLTTLRLFHDYPPGEATTIPEAATTIPAGTLRLLLTSIGYRAKARKEIRR